MYHSGYLALRNKFSLLHRRNPEEALEMECDHNRAAPGPRARSPGLWAGSQAGSLLLSLGLCLRLSV